MNLRQDSSLNMFQAVDAFLDAQAAKWGALATVAEAVNGFKICLQQLTLLANQQSNRKNKGYTSLIVENVTAMAEIAFSIAESVLCYAEKNNDLVMAHEVTYASAAALARGSRIAVVNRCKTIAGIVKENLGDLAAYQITADDVTKLEQSITVATGSESKRNVVSRQGSAASRSLAHNFIQTNKALKTLDRLIKRQLAKEESFTKAYLALRIVSVYHGGYPPKEIRQVQTIAAAQPEQQMNAA